jgi:hypothetical protein
MVEDNRSVKQFWQNGVVRCPHDNGPLKLKLQLASLDLMPVMDLLGGYAKQSTDHTVGQEP